MRKSANLIGIALHVGGPWWSLHVVDNQEVKQATCSSSSIHALPDRPSGPREADLQVARSELQAMSNVVASGSRGPK